MTYLRSNQMDATNAWCIGKKPIVKSQATITCGVMPIVTALDVPEMRRLKN